MKNFISFGDMETLLSGIGSKIEKLRGDMASGAVAYDDTELRGLIAANAEDIESETAARESAVQGEASARAAADSALQSSLSSLSGTVSGHTGTLATHTQQIAALQSAAGTVKASLSGNVLYLNW